MITDFQAKYYALELTRQGGSGVDRLGRALFDACVDLNPHQIEAALFALRSPISKGVLLADEVGLGKTIEAGLVLCQYWAEKRRNLLVICPASLRKQWAMEISEKFNIPNSVLDAKTYREEKRNGIQNPFDGKGIKICSMHYAASKAEDIKQIAWDLVVIDEAHKLRNAYRESNRIGQKVRWAIDGRRKILLTATPLQNSLLELYGLSTLIDERLFGDLPSFRTQYMNYGGEITGLRDRLKGFSWRTLRRQVLEYVRYTERLLITRPFTPNEQEVKLYEAVSSYLQRDDVYALPQGQRHLLVLLIRKVLASSPQAVAGTLEIMRQRLLGIRKELAEKHSVIESLVSDEDLDDDLLDQLLEDEEDDLVEANGEEPDSSSQEKLDQKKLDAEISELEDYIRWARSIGVDSKSKALLTALHVGFEKMEAMGASGKAVIFTESRRTQSWLQEFLESNGYLGKVLTFNGSNRDALTTKVYEEWVQEYKDSGVISGSRAIDVRTAIIDRFEKDKQILIATEAGAEGINLQFCSLVVNYDLPWNPQRIEQRIGRCHRYGQKHDVVVINFLNEKNAADRRVYELLDHKFNLFSGVFGASDEVLGSIESGTDFEKRVLEIYQKCRTEDEIQEAFSHLQQELDEQIQSKMRDTRRLILEHFDEDVHERLKTSITGTHEKLDRMGKLFWSLTKHELSNHAVFDDADLAFSLKDSPANEIPLGTYYLISKFHKNVIGGFLYRLSHPLGVHVVNAAKTRDHHSAAVVFDISHHPTRISVINALKGNSGWLRLEHLSVDSFDREEYLLFSAVDDKGKNLDQETCEKLMLCSAYSRENCTIPSTIDSRLESECRRHSRATVARNLEENNHHFNEARDQLDKWVEDMEMAAQKELDDAKRLIRELQRRSRQAPTIEEQHSFQEEIAKLERKKRTLRERIFDVEDEIAEKRDRLVEALEKRMQQKTTVTPVFTIRWSVM